MTSTYVGRDFQNVNTAPPQPPPMFTPVVQQPAPFPESLGVNPRIDDVNTLYRPSNPPEEDQRSEHSNSSSSSSSSSDSRYRHSKSYEPSSSSSDENHVRAKRRDEEDQEFYDYRFIWATGFFLMAVAAAYFYWITTWDCCTVENEETNMTMQYAIDQFTRSKQPGEKGEPGALNETLQEGVTQ